MSWLQCNQLKMVAADGKRYLTDCLPQDELLRLIESVPSKHASAFARWLITGEITSDEILQSVFSNFCIGK